MTWWKFGDEFADKCAEAGLSDAAFRTHVEGIGYLYRIEQMELLLQKRLVRKWAGSEAYEAAIVELVRGGFWEDAGTAWRVVHHADVIRQSLTAQNTKRVAEKERLRRKRAAAREARDEPDVTRDVGTNVGPTQTDRQTDRKEHPEPDLQDQYIDPSTSEVPTLATPAGRRSFPPAPTPGDRRDRGPFETARSAGSHSTGGRGPRPARTNISDIEKRPDDRERLDAMSVDDDESPTLDPTG